CALRRSDPMGTAGGDRRCRRSVPPPIDRREIHRRHHFSMTSSPDRSAPAAQRLWGGRFSAEPTPEMDRLNRSLPIDRRLWREDSRGSRAWAEELGRADVIAPEEAATLVAGLERVEERLASWSPAEWAAPADEDIHSLVERLLRAEVGAVAGKLHTG